MGMWGEAPMDNDAACDWSEQLFESTTLEDRVRTTLNGDIHDEPEQIRAAAHHIKTLIATDICPSASRRELTRVASRQLQRILDEKIYTNSLLVAEIRREITELSAVSVGRQR